MRRTIVVAWNQERLRPCVLDSLSRGELPVASLGEEPGYALLAQAGQLAIYTDHGWSSGMRSAYCKALALGMEIDERTLLTSELNSRDAIFGRRESLDWLRQPGREVVP